MIPARYRTTLRCLYLYAALAYAGFQRGIFMLLLIERGFSKVQLGTLESALFWANVLSEVPTGIFGDRYGRKLSVVIGLALLIVNAVGTIYCRHYYPFLWLFILEGVALAFISGSDLALVYESLRRMGRQADYIRVSSRFRQIAYLSHGLTIAIGGLLRRWSWGWVYGAAAVAWLCAVVALLPVREGGAPPAGVESEPTSGESSGDVDESGAGVSLQLLRFFLSGPGRGLLGLIAALALFDAAVTPYFVYSPLLFSSYGLDATRIGLLNGLVDLLAAVPLMFAARLALRPDQIIVLTMLGSGALIGLNLIRCLPLALAIYIFVMVGPILMEVLVDNLIQTSVPSAIRASTSSCVSLAESLAVGIAYLAYGALMDHVAVRVALAAGALVTFPASILALLHFRKARAPMASESAVAAVAS